MTTRPLRALLLAGALACPAPAAAQSAGPGPDLWLAELRHDGATPSLGPATNLTRRAGYDNQPWFTPDGAAILFVAEHDGQTDVYRHEFATGTTTQITRTPEWREYSPTLSPDGAELHVVRWDRPVERGELWAYSPQGEPRAPIRGGVAQVGYYAFADPGTLALFVNDSVRSFVVADTRSGRPDTVTTGIGGSAPQRVPGARAVSVLARAADGEWWITRYDPVSRAFRPLVRTLSGQTQYAWTRRGTILTARGNTVYEWDPRGGIGWATVGRVPGVREISRIAISPAEDRIVFVAEPSR